MKRPITLYTGQWADMPLVELVQKAQEWGLDGPSSVKLNAAYESKA